MEDDGNIDLMSDLEKSIKRVDEAGYDITKMHPLEILLLGSAMENPRADVAQEGGKICVIDRKPH